MTRAAIIDGRGVVSNIIVADPAEVPGSLDGTGAAIGDVWDGE